MVLIVVLLSDERALSCMPAAPFDSD